MQSTSQLQPKKYSYFHMLDISRLSAYSSKKANIQGIRFSRSCIIMTSFHSKIHKKVQTILKRLKLCKKFRIRRLFWNIIKPAQIYSSLQGCCKTIKEYDVDPLKFKNLIQLSRLEKFKCKADILQKLAISSKQIQISLKESEDKFLPLLSHFTNYKLVKIIDYTIPTLTDKALCNYKLASSIKNKKDLKICFEQGEKEMINPLDSILPSYWEKSTFEKFYSMSVLLSSTVTDINGNFSNVKTLRLDLNLDLDTYYEKLDFASFYSLKSFKTHLTTKRSGPQGKFPQLFLETIPNQLEEVEFVFIHKEVIIKNLKLDAQVFEGYIEFIRKQQHSLRKFSFIYYLRGKKQLVDDFKPIQNLGNKMIESLSAENLEELTIELYQLNFSQIAEQLKINKFQKLKSLNIYSNLDENENSIDRSKIDENTQTTTLPVQSLNIDYITKQQLIQFFDPNTLISLNVIKSKTSQKPNFVDIIHTVANNFHKIRYFHHYVSIPQQNNSIKDEIGPLDEIDIDDAYDENEGIFDQFNEALVSLVTKCKQLIVLNIVCSSDILPSQWFVDYFKIVMFGVKNIQKLHIEFQLRYSLICVKPFTPLCVVNTRVRQDYEFKEFKRFDVLGELDETISQLIEF